jgi:ATP-dependent DNA ligase
VNSHALHFRSAPAERLCVWVFDLLFLNEEDFPQRPLVERKRRLEKLVLRARLDRLCYSESFTDGVKLQALIATTALDPPAHDLVYI